VNPDPDNPLGIRSGFDPEPAPAPTPGDADAGKGEAAVPGPHVWSWRDEAAWPFGESP
jgi:hypothetical protein